MRKSDQYEPQINQQVDGLGSEPPLTPSAEKVSYPPLVSTDANGPNLPVESRPTPQCGFPDADVHGPAQQIPGTNVADAGVDLSGDRNTLIFLKDGVSIMKYRTRTFYTDKLKSEMWGRCRSRIAKNAETRMNARFD